jgi:hypothetical protein
VAVVFDKYQKRKRVEKQGEWNNMSGITRVEQQESGITRTRTRTGGLYNFKP